MARKGDFQVAGVVIEARPNATFRVQLANGHVVLGHFPRAKEKSATTAIRLLPDEKVLLEMTPYDLSRGRIISRQDELVSRAGDVPSDRLGKFPRDSFLSSEDGSQARKFLNHES